MCGTSCDGFPLRIRLSGVDDFYERDIVTRPHTRRNILTTHIHIPTVPTLFLSFLLPCSHDCDLGAS